MSWTPGFEIPYPSPSDPSDEGGGGTGGDGSGVVDEVVQGPGILVDSTNPANPQVSVDDSHFGTAAFAEAEDFASADQGALADSAVQPADLDDYVTQAEFYAQGPSGRELAYAGSSQSVTISDGTEVDLAGLSITFTVGSRPVYVEARLPWVSQSVAGNSCSIIITDAANNHTAVSSVTAPTVGGIGSPECSERIDTPGTYTRKVRVQRIGSGDMAIGLGFDYAAITNYIRAVER